MTARITDQGTQPRACLTAPGPGPIRVGAGTAVRLEGTLAGVPGRVRLRIRLGAEERAVDGLARGDGGELIWWAVMPIAADGGEGPREATLVVEGGGRAELALGSIAFERGLTPATAPDEAGDPPLIAICMATYEPRLDWLVRQLDSIRAQGWRNWICLISDDGSGAEALARIEQAVGGDPRFVVSPGEERLGFYGNFERALGMVPAEAGLVALADQDDRWDPDKLEALHATLSAEPRAMLAYSDMRIATEEGEIIADTYWYLGRNSSDDIASQMVNNAVTGAASLFRRELLETALPFPPRASDDQYHDHWLGLCAMAVGELAFLDRPTYDYTRHGDSVTLRASSAWTAPPRSRREWVSMHWRRWTRRLRMGLTPLGWRAIYFDRFLMMRQLIAVLELRAGERMRPERRRSLRRLAAAERSPVAAAWLLGRTLRPLAGRNETLGRERVLFGSLIWRWSAAVALRLRGRSRDS